jgi:hypothetical protein
MKSPQAHACSSELCRVLGAPWLPIPAPFLCRQGVASVKDCDLDATVGPVNQLPTLKLDISAVSSRLSPLIIWHSNFPPSILI